MKKELTTDRIISVFNLINNAKLGKMANSDKFSLIKIVRQFKKVSNDFDDLLKDAQGKLKPENFDDIAHKMQSKTPLTAEEMATVNRYNSEVSDCVRDELDKKVEFEFEPLSEDALGLFMESNDFSVHEALMLSETICG